MEEHDFCLACGKKMKILKDINGDPVAYHLKCWSKLLSDIKNFDKVAEKKYNYVPLYSGLTNILKFLKCNEIIIKSYELQIF